MSFRWIGVAAGIASFAAAPVATAQTWEGGRTTPSGLELVAVDATGELFWPHGFEDVAGDGDTFQPPEPSFDVRTAYASTDDSRFWARIYVADPEAPGANVIGFVFVDGDENAATGGSAAATDVHPGLTADPTGGGWDAVLVLRGDGSAPTVWTWNQGPDVWDQETLQPADVAGETGRAADPIEVGLDDTHGYLQGSASHGLLGLDAVCGARLFVRTVVDAGGGDLDVGVPGACTPPDANADGVPDLAVPAQCDADDDCPFDGICQGGSCAQTELCFDATDCDANEDCAPDGRCVARPGGSCEDDTTCDSLLCEAGTCAVCTPGGADCGAGRRCAADGRCVDGDDPGAGVGTGAGGSSGAGLSPGEEVQGGACACVLASSGSPRNALGAVALATLLVLGRRQARRRAPRRDPVPVPIPGPAPRRDPRRAEVDA